MKIPLDALSADALRNIVESYVLQEGTDYGEQGYSLAQKCEHVLRQLRQGEAEVDFDPVTETVNILPRRALR